MAMLRYLTSSVEFLFLKQLSKVNWVNGFIHFLKLCSERLDKSNYYGGQKRLRKKYLSWEMQVDDDIDEELLAWKVQGNYSITMYVE